MEIEIVGGIRGVRTIATGPRIRELKRLVLTFGPGRWRKRKGLAMVVSRTAPWWRPRYNGTKPMASDDASSR